MYPIHIGAHLGFNVCRYHERQFRPRLRGLQRRSGEHYGIHLGLHNGDGVGFALGVDVCNHGRTGVIAGIGGDIQFVAGYADPIHPVGDGNGFRCLNGYLAGVAVHRIMGRLIYTHAHHLHEATAVAAVQHEQDLSGFCAFRCKNADGTHILASGGNDYIPSLRLIGAESITDPRRHYHSVCCDNGCSGLDVGEIRLVE